MCEYSLKTRWFVVTNWNVDCDYTSIIGKGQIRFVAYGDEICPDSGRPHHQVFCYFHNPRSPGATTLGKIGDMFGEQHCFAKAMYGSILQNESYCMKESSLIKVGSEPKQGYRGDLEETKELLISGDLTTDMICEENPMMFHQYGRTLERLELIGLRKKWRKSMTQGLWITGPSGSGKSHMAMDGYDPSTHYIKNLNEDWWDGYKGQEIVILNEFRGQVKFSELLDLVDEWPKTVKWRCRESVPFLAKKLIITSIKSPHEVYCNITNYNDDEPWEQFERRFKIVVLAKRDLEQK